MQIGFYPFWFWNDRLEEGELRRQIGEMAEKGIKGFYIHPRQGLQQPYLSKSYFRMVDVAVEAAMRNGLTAHLYDEFPYPSGAAGGKVILGNPKYWATELVQHRYEVSGGPIRIELPRGSVLQAVAYPVQNGVVDWTKNQDLSSHIGPVLVRSTYGEAHPSAYNRKRFLAAVPTPVLEVDLPAAPHAVFVSIQAVVSRFKYWGNYVDLLNPAAVEEFIRLTYDAYKARYSSLFGTTIPSIFVDEAAPQSWSPAIPPAFKRTYGYELLDNLEALQDTSHPRHGEVTCDLYRLKYELFCSVFEAKISGWCRKNGIAYTGEKPSLRFSQLRFMDIPGCDPGHTKAGAEEPDVLGGELRNNARAAASAAYFYGKQGSLCECCHSMGWGATIQDAKYIAEILLLMGIDYLVPHGFFYSSHGLRKHDAPPSFFFQMPYWRFWDRLSERIDTLAEYFKGTWIDARILIIDPNGGVPTGDDLCIYESAMRRLMEEHIEFQIVDTDVLRDARMAEGRLLIRDLSALLVVVPPMQNVEPELRHLLAGLEECGVAIIRLETGAFSASAFIEEIEEHAVPKFRITAKGGGASKIWSVHRRSETERVWFLLNTGAVPVSARLSSDEALQEIPLQASETALLRPISGSEGEYRYVRDIRPFESLLIRASKSGGDGSSNPPSRLRVRIPARLAFRLLEKNLLRMYRWKLSIADATGKEIEGAEVAAAPLINQLDEGGFRFAPVIRHGFGVESALFLPELRLRYAFRFRCDFTGAIFLVMEPDSISGDWSITVNGNGFLEPKSFLPASAHVRGSREVDISTFIKRGLNTISVSILASKPDHGLLSALYLAGDFGVRTAPPSIIRLPQKGGFESYAKNRIPYCAGIVQYRFLFEAADPHDIPREDETLIELIFPRPFHEAAEISINGGPPIPTLWEPRTIRVPAGLIRSGPNECVLRVHTTLIRSFEGEWFDENLHKTKPVEEEESPISDRLSTNRRRMT